MGLSRASAASAADLLRIAMVKVLNKKWMTMTRLKRGRDVMRMQSKETRVSVIFIAVVTDKKMIISGRCRFLLPNSVNHDIFRRHIHIFSVAAPAKLVAPSCHAANASSSDLKDQDFISYRYVFIVSYDSLINI